MADQTPVGQDPQRGMALVLVVAIISVLSAVVIRFNSTTRSSMEEVYGYQDDTVLAAMVESGIEIGCAILAGDRRESDLDALSESWALLGTQNLDELFEQGELRVSIVDLSGRFPINRLVAGDLPSLGGTADGDKVLQFRQVLLRLLVSGEFALTGEADAREIVDSLTDWLDPDDEALPFGAESDYYLSLERPYIARNGPLEFIDELLQVKGMTPEILYGNNEKKGLAEYIGIYGGDRININTAPRLLLKSLADGITEEAVETADVFRNDQRSVASLADPQWYRNLIGWPQESLIDGGLITTSSKWFRIDAAARFRNGRMQRSADVGRADLGLYVVYRSVE